MPDRRPRAKALMQYGFAGTLAVLTAYGMIPSRGMLAAISLAFITGYSTFKIREKYGVHLHHEKSTAAAGTWLNAGMMIYGILLYLLETVKFKLS